MNDPIERLTDKQLHRALENLVARIGPGWDRPPLSAARPAAGRALDRVRAEIRRRSHTLTTFWGGRAR